MPQPTGDALFKWADAFRRRTAGRFPTWAQARRKFRTTLDGIENAIEEAKDHHPIEMVVGFQIGGGGGYSTIERRADYQIETWKENADGWQML